MQALQTFSLPARAFKTMTAVSTSSPTSSCREGFDQMEARQRGFALAIAIEREPFSAMDMMLTQGFTVVLHYNERRQDREKGRLEGFAQRHVQP